MDREVLFKESMDNPFGSSVHSTLRYLHSPTKTGGAYNGETFTRDSFSSLVEWWDDYPEFNNNPGPVLPTTAVREEVNKHINPLIAAYYVLECTEIS